MNNWSRRTFLKRMGWMALAAAAPAPFWACEGGGEGDDWFGPDQGRVLTMSDVHFDPFYDPALVHRLVAADYPDWPEIFQSSAVVDPNGYHQETNYPLWVSALEAMAGLDRPDFVLFTGDFIRHGFADHYTRTTGSSDPAEINRFIYKTIGCLARMIGETFPGRPILWTLGNNDSYCGDYFIAPEGDFLADTADLLGRHFIDGRADPGDFYHQFPLGGRFSMPAPLNPNGRIVSVNAVFWSVNYQNRCGAPAGYDPGRGELEYLEAELARAEANREKVWLLLHIPPGVNVFSTVRDHMRGGRIDRATMFWQDQYNRDFLALAHRYGSVLTAAFAGHTHMDDFRLIFDPGQNRLQTFTHITPALNALFGNNPGFQVATYDRDSFRLEELVTIYRDLGQARNQWRTEYVFSTAYDRPAYNGPQLETVHARMAEDSQAKQNYMTYYNVSQTDRPALNDDNYRAYWTGIRYLTETEFVEAYNQEANAVKAA